MVPCDGRRLRTQTRFDLALGDVCGEMALRQAIVEYLRLSRSIECEAEQVFITSGYAAAMSLTLQALSGVVRGCGLRTLVFR